MSLIFSNKCPTLSAILLHSEVCPLKRHKKAQVPAPPNLSLVKAVAVSLSATNSKGLLGWTLIQYNWCPYKKRNLERKTHFRENEDTQEHHLQSKGRLMLP